MRRTSCVFESSHLSRNAERLARESCTQHVMYGYEILRNRSYVPEREFPVVRLIYFLGVRVEFGWKHTFPLFPLERDAEPSYSGEKVYESEFIVIDRRERNIKTYLFLEQWWGMICCARLWDDWVKRVYTVVLGALQRNESQMPSHCRHRLVLYTCTIHWNAYMTVIWDILL